MRASVSIDVSVSRAGQFDRTETYTGPHEVKLTYLGKVQLVSAEGSVIEFWPQELESATGFLRSAQMGGY